MDFKDESNTVIQTSNNITSLSCNEQVCLMRLSFNKYFSQMMGEVSLEI